MSAGRGRWVGVALALGVATSVGTGCATREADTARWQAPLPGATWTVALRNAGNFDTWRVRCTTTIGNDEVYWMSEPLGISVKTRVVRSAASPFGAGTQEAELIAHTIAR